MLSLKKRIPRRTDNHLIKRTLRSLSLSLSHGVRNNSRIICGGGTFSFLRSLLTVQCVEGREKKGGRCRRENILAGQKEASPYRQKISTSFHKDRDLSPGRPKGFCRGSRRQKYEPLASTPCRDSTVSRIAIHGGPRPDTAILKLSSITREMRHAGSVRYKKSLLCRG